MLKNNEMVGLIHKIESKSIKLNEISNVKAGLKAYEVGKGNPVQTKSMKEKRVYHSNYKLSNEWIRYLDGKDVRRYYLTWSGEYLKYGDNLAASRKDFNLFSTKRILVRQIPSKPPYCINACLTDEIILNDLNSMNIINIKFCPEYILAVLNSKLMSFWFIYKFGKLQRGIFPQFKINELEIFPIKNILSDEQNPFVAIVDKILAITKDKDYLQNLAKQAKVKEYERRIDEMVYKLYDLTTEEIAIVEGSQS